MKEGVIQSDVATVIQPRVLFKPGSWLSKIDFINHLILFNNVLITVLSEKEGGKTSFCTLLQDSLDQQIKSTVLTIKPPCHYENIISDIAAQLHLNYDENTDISSIVAQINERKAHVVLLIDNAQHLPESFIKNALLAIKGQEHFSFFHLCLISDYSIVVTLNHLVASFFDNLVHTIELGALTENEARTYVLQRAMAAHLITKPLTDIQFKQFYQLTKGNVAKINNNLETFILKCSTQKKKNPIKIIKRASIAASVAIVAGLAGFYFSQSFNLYSNQKTSTISNQNERVVSSVAPPLQPKILVSHIASWQDSSIRQLVYSALPKKQILDDIDSEASMGTVALVDKVVVLPKLKAKKLVKEESRMPASYPVVPESKLVAISEVIRNKLSSNKYTIQLAASHNIEDVQRFKERNKLFTDNTKIRNLTNAKGVWYVLTIGEYESRAEAQRNVSKLPPSLVKWKPWVRPTSNLG